MKFLVDQNLSPRLAGVLGEHGHDALHTSDLGLDVASDADVLGRARTEGRILISADSDFGTILASTRAVRPSVLYIRRVQGRRVDELAELIVGNLELVEQALEEGSLVVLVKAMRESAGCRSSDRHFDTHPGERWSGPDSHSRSHTGDDTGVAFISGDSAGEPLLGAIAKALGDLVAGQIPATTPIRTGTPMARKASGH